MEERQPEAGNEILYPDNLIDWRGAIPINVIVAGGAVEPPLRFSVKTA